jgi:tetratricopeptide (TPR) repeat protein
MSEHKQAGVVASVNSGMTVAARGKHPHHRFRAKLMVLSFLGVLIVAGVVFVVYHEYYAKTKTPTQNITVSSTQKAGPVPGFTSFTPSEKAQYYVSQQNYAAATSVYQQQLASATTKTAKSAAYISLYTAALDAGNTGQAYQDCVEAYTLDPSYQTAMYVGAAAQENNDNKNAAKYYQIAMNDLSPSTPSYSFMLQSVKNDLKGVTQ